MTASASLAARPSSADPVLNDLIDELTNKLHAGEAVDIEAYVAEHPDYADQLRRLFPALQVLADLSRSGTASFPPSTADGSPLPRELGDFLILREIGRGGMGVVYEAEQISLGRRVALKVLPLAATLDARQLQRFHNEARAAACLHHEHIVPIHAVGCERGVHYYAMQFVEGQTLSEVIEELRKARETNHKDTKNTEEKQAKEAGPQDTVRGQQSTMLSSLCSSCLCGSTSFFQTVAEWGIEAAEALEHAHSLGIVHRDIKPANLIIENSALASPLSALKLWVTDFGLAHVQGDKSLTMTGDIVGTLRYMSPEQALAKRVIIDHRTDIYSLGVTLYELLTLEPAFGGGDRQELLRQIAFDEPKPPRRINKSIPAELETIVLKAMEKNAGERYATAQELADDLERFIKHEPIQARRPKLWHRLRKLARRHRPVFVTAALGLFVILTVLAGGIGWIVRDSEARRAAAAAREAEIERAAETDLHEAEGHQKAERWEEETRSLERAEGRLAVGGPANLREQVARMKRDVAMVTRLEKARMLASVNDNVEASTREADRAYAAAFVEYGLDPQTLTTEEATRRVRDSAIGTYLITAWDEWSFSQRPGSGKSLQAIARLADDDPLRQRLRDLLERQDRAALESFAGENETLSLPPAHLHRLSQTLVAPGANLKFLRKARQRYPRDFWLNAILGATMQGEAQRDRAAALEAAGYMRVALAVRPQAPQVWNILGILLNYAREWSDGEDAFRKAIELLPKYAGAYSNLGIALAEQGKPEEAEPAFRKAVELQPKDAVGWMNLGSVFAQQKKYARAEAAYRESINLQPKHALAYSNLGAALQNQDKLEKAEEAFRKAMKLQPELPQAHCNLGDVLIDQGRFKEALPYLQRGHELGSQKPQVWPHPSAKWIKDCERLIELDAKLPKVLKGEPAEVGERLELARMCQRYKGLNLTAIRLYSGVFAERPQLADDLRVKHRYDAACVAALAGCGQGKDADQSNDEERVRLRRQALDWLRADLAAYRRLLELEPEKTRPMLAKTMKHWQEDKDFAGVRGPDALAKLPDAERQAWLTLWEDVEALRQAASPELLPPPKAVPPGDKEQRK